MGRRACYFPAEKTGRNHAAGRQPPGGNRRHGAGPPKKRAGGGKWASAAEAHVREAGPDGAPSPPLNSRPVGGRRPEGKGRCGGEGAGRQKTEHRREGLTEHRAGTRWQNCNVSDRSYPRRLPSRQINFLRIDPFGRPLMPMQELAPVDFEGESRLYAGIFPSTEDCP